MTEGRTVAYDDALKSSLEYFNGNDLAAKIFVDKYALRDKEQALQEATPDDMHRRIAREICRIERKKFKKPMTLGEVLAYFKDFKRIVPQGSPMYGIGNPFQYVTLSNCYVIPPPADSYSGICRADEELVQISKRRGGCGLDISELRPAGTPTSNAAKSSTGIISFMRRYSNSIREVGQHGRRGALLISISVHHPEVLRFATCKRDLKQITGANISIRLTNEFLEAVKKGKKYEVRWPVDAAEPKISHKLDAREVWMTIIENAHATGEPGLLFWDKILEESPADCYADQGYRTVSTNPCSELPLSAYDSCRLLVLNTFTYVREPFTKDATFDYEQFNKDAQVAQRFMDDIIDLEIESVDRILKKIKSDPEAEELKRVEIELWNKIKERCSNGRRTGTGVTGIGDTLAALGIKYGSQKSIETVGEIYKTLKLACYRASVEMAKELGAFAVWNHKAETKHPYLLRIKDEDPELWKDMSKYGRRNIACLTTAPAGSVSILTETTSGIEPLFQMQYMRRKKVNPNDQDARIDFVDETGDTWQEFQVYHPKVKLWMDITNEAEIDKSPWSGCCADDINWHNRVKLQAEATKHIDHSISSTVNLPHDVSVKTVAAIYEEAWKAGCKGITVYRKDSRTGVLIDNKSKKKDEDCDDCRRTNKSRQELAHIDKTHAPKRPKELPCNIYHVTVKGELYFVMVGLMADEPYEVFAGRNGKIKKTAKKGVITKVKRGQYDLTLDDGTLIENLGSYAAEDQEAITRMTSTALRHGADIAFVVHQLEKVKGDLQSLARSMSRTLKKYIPNGTKVSGEICEECKMENTLVREEGCIKCVSCGWTRCS